MDETATEHAEHAEQVEQVEQTTTGVIDYAAALPGDAPTFRREPDALVLVIPPPPPWRRLLAPAALLAGASLLAAGPLAMAAALFADPSGWPVVVLLGLTCAGLWLLALRHLRCRAQLARQPSAVRVTNELLSITLPGAAAEDRLQWPRAHVRDLRVTATGALPVVQEYLWLRVTPLTGAAAMVQVPWAQPRPGVGRVVEIERTLREALGLPMLPQ